jgi:hypothetical protein
MISTGSMRGGVHNRGFLAVVLAGLVIAIYQMFQPDGLALGYGIIAVGLALVAAFLWSKARKPKV